jgi:hypothetical protein
MNTGKEENLTFYKNNSLISKFIIKYLYYYFLYGWLFLLGTIITGLLFLYLFNLTYDFIKYLQLLWLIPTTYCFFRFVRILATTKYKYRLFRIEHYRLYTRAYMVKSYKVEEVNAGICTCTLRGVTIEKCIESNVKQGWIFEQMEPVMGWFSLIFPRYKMIIVFQKNNHLLFGLMRQSLF